LLRSVFCISPAPACTFAGEKNNAMTKKYGSKKDTPIQENPEENTLEKEIEDMISKEKTRRTIVSKLLGKSNSKNKKSEN
jgi:ribosomal protein L13